MLARLLHNCRRPATITTSTTAAAGVAWTSAAPRLAETLRRHRPRARFHGTAAATTTTSSSSSHAQKAHASVDDAEVAKFGAHASRWWSADGPVGPLLRMNACRVGFICRATERYLETREREHGRDAERVQGAAGTPTTASSTSSSSSDATGSRDDTASTTTRTRRRQPPLHNIRAVDIGCGGGVLSEPLARLGATVLGVDASHEAIAAARAHLRRTDPILHRSGRLHYAQGTVEQMAAAVTQDAGAGVVPGRLRDSHHCNEKEKREEEEEKRGAPRPFDLVTALEVIEHVREPRAFLHHLAALVRPGGLLFVSTLDRSLLSYAVGVVAAERVARVLPRGMHDWRRFIQPEELCAAMEDAPHMRVMEASGMAPEVVGGGGGAFRLVRCTAVNYIVVARKALTAATTAVGEVVAAR